MPFVGEIGWKTLLVGLRISGLLSFAPVLGSAAVPARIKAMLALVLTFAMAQSPQIAIAPGVNLWAVVLSELAIGFVIGLSAQLLFEGIQAAGHYAGLQIGFSLVNIIDPQSQVDTPVMSLLYQTVATVIFLGLNVHHWLLRSIAKSWAYLPPGTLFSNAQTAVGLLQAAGAIWLTAVQLAAPVMVATMVTDVALAFAGKVAPQVPVLLVGIPVKALLVYCALITSIAFWPGFLEQRFAGVIGLGERLLRVAH